MVRRARIGNELSKAWTQTVKRYGNREIASERNLQACLFSDLSAELGANRRIFVEPTIVLPSGAKIIPDMVICNTREVICFLELKFSPRGKPDRIKDMRSISSVAGSNDIKIRLRRYRGPGPSSMEVAVAKTVLFAWAGIHAGSTTDSEVWTEPAFRTHPHIELHALTGKEQLPVVSYNVRGLRIKTGRAIARE